MVSDAKISELYYGKEIYLMNENDNGYVIMRESCYNNLIHSVKHNRDLKTGILIGGLVYWIYRKLKKIKRLETENAQLKEENEALYFKTKESNVEQ